MRSETFRLRKEGIFGFVESLKLSMVGTQRESQMLISFPEDNDQQVPFLTMWMHFKIPFQSQEAEGEA